MKPTKAAYAPPIALAHGRAEYIVMDFKILSI
jgi:hypothetical protein